MSEPEKQEPKSKEEGGTEVSRRDFLSEVAGGALGIAAVGSGIVTVKYISPNVLFEPPPTFRVGPAENYPINSVTTITDQLTYLVRVPQGFYAETMICQHLGCITAWHPEDNLIECPCHGSEYKKDGAIVRGPTVRPLPHFAMRLMPDGTLLIDKSAIVPRAQILKV
jgi:cytochrome b6-f complex iron-sulfur subunit